MTVVMSHPRMSAEAKSWLSSTVRGLRERLLKDLADQVESTYRLSIPAERAGLDEERALKRQRLEEWLREQARGGTKGAKETPEQVRERHLRSAVKLAAATFLNRLVVLRQMEALGLVRVKSVTGGWNSPGYRDFREFGPALLHDESEGYATLLRLTFEELALDLPGLFGEVGVNSLIPIPTATLRHTVEALEGDGLSAADGESLWRDDTLLGWVYQFWNDPEREALDEKIRNRGKIENHEIAAKTQLFTDRYMVEWLLQNSLGQLWFGICEKNGWAPQVESDGTLDRLAVRRTVWRGKREREEVDLEALMPLESEAEERWKYWVPRKLPKDSAEHAPASLKDARVLDPACGSGHFLVIAFDLLVALYEEEARHRGEAWSREQIACWIVENNLHGIDIDPRAVQIAAAALWLKVKGYAVKAEPRKLNLVASNLGLGSLPADDPALLELEQAVETETGIPAALTRRIVESLKGADYLGSLLKVSETIDAAISEHEEKVGLTGVGPSQGDLFSGFAPNMFAVSAEEARKTLLGKLGVFLSRHTGSADLGLRLRGEQLAAGVRFIQIVKEGQYDLITGNPPYAGSGSMRNVKYIEKHYRDGKADICVAFMIRGFDLLKPGGMQLLLTLRGWMFIKQFQKAREWLVKNYALHVIGDFDWGAFEQIVGKVLCVTAAMFLKRVPVGEHAVAIQPFPLDTPYRNDNRRAYRKEAATLAQVGRHEFTPDHLSVVPGHPLIYWWDDEFLARYARLGNLGDTSPGRAVQSTGNNTWFTRFPWELQSGQVFYTNSLDSKVSNMRWQPFLNGAAGFKWFEPARAVITWYAGGLMVKLQKSQKTGGSSFKLANQEYYLRLGVAFSMIGADFTARAHRYRSVFGNMGSSVFPVDIPETLCLMNSQLAKKVLESLNPGVHFEVGDVNRLPLFPIESADEIVAQLDVAFTEHEQAREASVEFQKPGPSAWTYAQDWAQRAVDRPKGEPLPPYEPVYEDETPLDHLSFALGVTLGRFDKWAEAQISSRLEYRMHHPDQAEPRSKTSSTPMPAFATESAPRTTFGDGILEPTHQNLPHGILFLANSGGPDSLEHPAARPLLDAWEQHGPRINSKLSARHYLREKFFKDDHLKRYEKRPIYFPLTSTNKNFVAYISIHRWQDDTLQTLLAEHLQPELSRLAAELADLGEARATGNRDSQAKAQSRYEEVQALHQELHDFNQLVSQIAERGAPPTDSKCPPREDDARFRMDLDDGVMINSAALWPLLEPQWKDPKKWWSELCNAKGRKDYDWAHLSARYFPTRVDQKCQEDPSLAVAHGCFWKYHPVKAYQWELRLQSPDELGADFSLDEDDSNTHRANFETQHPDKVQELRAAEQKRRDKKANKTTKESDQLRLQESE